MIRFILSELRIPNAIFHIYADSDIDRHVLLDLAEFVFPFKIPIYLHRNGYSGEKDFGVPANKIIDVVERISP